MIITGYQQGILYATGCQTGDRFSVRNKDRWYCDAVQPIFGTKVYPNNTGDTTQYIVKARNVHAINADDVSDWTGFCRAYIEIHGVLDLAHRKSRKGEKVHYPRLRIYGKADILVRIMDVLPAKTKKIQHVCNVVDSIYIGETSAVYYQSRSEITEILAFINECPRNEAIWQKWSEIMKFIC